MAAPEMVAAVRSSTNWEHSRMQCCTDSDFHLSWKAMSAMEIFIENRATAAMTQLEWATKALMLMRWQWWGSGHAACTAVCITVMISEDRK